MWVRTQEGDLVNLDQVEWIVVEAYDESEDEAADEYDYEEEGEEEEESRLPVGPEVETYELRAYQVGWNADAVGSSSFYTLSSSTSRATVEQHLKMLADALAAGSVMLAMPQPAAGWTS